MTQQISNLEGGGSVRGKLNEVIGVANTVPNKVDKLPTAQAGNVAVWGEGGVLLDSGVSPGGGEVANIPHWEDVRNDLLPIDFVVQYNGRLFASKVDDNQNNEPPLEGENTYWIETSESKASGTPEWVAGTYLTALSEVLKLNAGENKYYAYVLRAPVPFISSNFETELALGYWQLIGGSGGSITDPIAKIDLVPQNPLLPELKGRLQFDNKRRCVSIDLGNGVRQSLGMENTELLRNTGVTPLLNGRIVRVFGYDATTEAFNVVYSDNSSVETAYCDYLLTEDIAAGATGIGVKIGVVHDINTTGGSSSQPAWLGVQGQFTPTKPTYPSRAVVVGAYGNISATTGNILVDLNKSLQYITNDLQAQIDLKAMQNPGIDVRTPVLPIDIVIDPVANTLTITTVKGGEPITAANPVRFYTDGGGVIKEWVKTAPIVFPTFTNTYGVWYFHIDNSGVAVTTQTAWTDFNTISTVYRFLLNDTLPDATKIVSRAWECHLNDISATQHEWMHAEGTKHISGFDYVANVLAHSSGVPTTPPNADGRNTVISLTSGKNSDDGLTYTVNNSAVNAKFNQDLGHLTAGTLTSLNSGLFKVRTNDTGGKLNFLPAARFPFPFNATTNYPEYITTTGVRTAVGDGRWMVTYLYALQDDVFGEAIKVVTAETDFTTFALAQAHTHESLRNFYTTFRDKEIRQLYKQIHYVKYLTGGAYNVACKYAALVQVDDNRTTKQTPINVGTGIVLSTNVALATTPSGSSATNQDQYNIEVNQNIIDIETQLSANQLTFASIYGYYNFI